MTTKYTRQGVEAAVHLAKCADAAAWSMVEDRYPAMIRAKGGAELEKLDLFCETLVENMKKNHHISKDELLQVVNWKFRKGKPRHALMTHLKANSDEEVETHTKAGFDAANQGDIHESIKQVTKLRGVGPATASAILSIYRPELFAFMDDEVIECLYERKRGYTPAIYHLVNDKCSDLARQLGDKWTARRVGRALWTAARLNAEGCQDSELSDILSSDVKEVETTRRPTKRRKKSG